MGKSIRTSSVQSCTAGGDPMRGGNTARGSSVAAHASRMLQAEIARCDR